MFALHGKWFIFIINFSFGGGGQKIMEHIGSHTLEEVHPLGKKNRTPLRYFNIKQRG